MSAMVFLYREKGGNIGRREHKKGYRKPATKVVVGRGAVAVVCVCALLFFVVETKKCLTLTGENINLSQGEG